MQTIERQQGEWTGLPARGLAQITRVLIADPHPLFRQGLIATLRAVAPYLDCEEADDAASVAAALSGVTSSSIAFLDHAFLAKSYPMRRQETAHSEPAIILLSAEPGVIAFNHAIACGARGYIPKTTSIAEMAPALEEILSGRAVFLQAQPIAHNDRTSTPHLSMAQLRILAAAEKGKLNKQIAFEMGVAEATVKAHMSAIFKKLRVTNRTQAVVMFRETPLMRASMA